MVFPRGSGGRRFQGSVGCSSTGLTWVAHVSPDSTRGAGSSEIASLLCLVGAGCQLGHMSRESSLGCFVVVEESPGQAWQPQCPFCFVLLVKSRHSPARFRYKGIDHSPRWRVTEFVAVFNPIFCTLAAVIRPSLFYCLSITH